jgi:formamidopyrimidine-DNA glycosylase
MRRCYVQLRHAGSTFPGPQPPREASAEGSPTEQEGSAEQSETVGHGQPCPRRGSPITEITAGQRITNFCRHRQG